MKRRASRMYAVTLGITPTLIMINREERVDFYIEAQAGSGVTIGPESDQILKGLAVGDAMAADSFLGEMYGTVSSGTGTVLVWEIG